MHFAEQLSISAAHGPDDFPRSRVRRRHREPSEEFPNIVRWLVKHGYSDDDIAKVIGGNVMRVLDKVWWR